jgi:hypothetical protein
MLRTRWLRALVLALPGLALAGFGAAHPSGLNADNAHWWAILHIILLPVFPLLAAAQWHLLTPAPPALRWAGRLAVFGFAVFYTGLDAVAGIAAGVVTDTQHGYSPAVGQLFAVGDMLGYIGAWSFLVAGVLIVAGIAPRAGWRVVPGAVVLLLASVSFLDSHIFWPRGVYTMVGVAAGMFLLSYCPRQRDAASALKAPAAR